jgi:hypothetical protein
MKHRNKNNLKRLWSAVMVKRGYVGEVRIYNTFQAASGTARRWRLGFNPDYDEAAVVETRAVAQ